MSSPQSADRVPPRRGVAVIGSTGSIGRQALDVLAANTDVFRVVALAAGSNARLLEEQSRQFRPGAVALASIGGSSRLEVPAGVEDLSGDRDSLVRLVTRDDVDLAVVGTSGVVSLRPVLAALEAGKVVATANKETLVAAGHLVMAVARGQAARTRETDPMGPLASPLGWLRPIDSEHSAIWQCLAGEGSDAIGRLVLTASGGPFIDEPRDLANVTVEMALRHPTWRMGPKITIDSATLVNKGLEVIEAHWLYDVEYDVIDVVIHPESVVHSAVVFVDGSLKAQLGTPDMRIPIQYALTYPDRRPSMTPAPDLTAIGRLDFRAPDERRFPGLRIAREAGRMGPRASAALIAADDVAVARFLDGRLDFQGIPRLLEAAVGRYGANGTRAPALDELLALHAEVREAFARGPIGSAA
jgi:1-deoxy-D-xylulose-5-phosphate reductoisomerase